LDQQHAFAHRLKGDILLAQDLPDKATSNFFHAKEICPTDIASYEGMVECFLQRGQYSDAIMTAREAIEVAPRDPRAVTLVGLALSRAPQKEGRDRAKRAFRKALHLSGQPGMLRPLLALVDMCMEDGDLNMCVDLLQRGLEGSHEEAVGGMMMMMGATTSSTSTSGTGATDGTSTSTSTTHQHHQQDVLQTKLGEVLTLKEEFMDAMTCFHTALSINPDNLDAVRGLERLEKTMRGSGTMDEDGVSEDCSSQQTQQQRPTSPTY